MFHMFISTTKIVTNDCKDGEYFVASKQNSLTCCNVIRNVSLECSHVIPDKYLFIVLFLITIDSMRRNIDSNSIVPLLTNSSYSTHTSIFDDKNVTILPMIFIKINSQ